MNPVINKYVTKYWYNERNQLHREDGPAIEYKDGDKWWFKNGKRHREDGPAVEIENGFKSWYLYGKKLPCISQEEFERIMRLLAFL